MKKLLSMIGAMTLIGTASTSVIACDKGEAPTPPTPDTRTDLSSLSDNAEITLSSSTQTVAEFKTALINKLKEDSKFKKLSDTEVDITKSDSTQIQISDIVDGKLATKVKAKSTSRNFTGEKNINVTITINYTDEEIVNTINSVIDYQINQHFEENIIDFLKKDISTDFIKNKISNHSIKNSFIDSKFTLIKITKSDRITELQDTDFNFGTNINDCKIIYKYGTKNNQSVNLKINIPSPSTQDIINELEAKKYEIEANAGPNAFDDLDNNIQKNNFELITNSIKNEKIKNAFEISKFKLNNILTSDLSRGLNSSDFVSGQKLDAVLIFFYIKNQISLKLSINVK